VLAGVLDGVLGDDTAGAVTGAVVVEVTDDQQVALTAGDWGVILSAEEARLLGEALMDAADDAESGVE